MKWSFLIWIATVACGCSGLSIEYPFDPQEFTEHLGTPGTTQMLPTVSCTPGAMPDPCAAVSSQLPANSGTVSCDTTSHSCVATAEVRGSVLVDLTKAMTSVPSEVIQYGIRFVTLE